MEQFEKNFPLDIKPFVQQAVLGGRKIINGVTIRFKGAVLMDIMKDNYKLWFGKNKTELLFELSLYSEMDKNTSVRNAYMRQEAKNCTRTFAGNVALDENAQFTKFKKDESRHILRFRLAFPRGTGQLTNQFWRQKDGHGEDVTPENQVDYEFVPFENEVEANGEVFCQLTTPMVWKVGFADTLVDTLEAKTENIGREKAKNISRGNTRVRTTYGKN